MRIAVAMSGGVDSSVAAHILKQRGHEVIGLTMKIWPCGAEVEADGRACCDPGSVRVAERVAGELGIRHYVVGMRATFERHVVRDFLLEYSRGRTPNPCVVCNRYVKFGPFLRRAEALGATHLATGHHAIVERSDATGTYLLKRGADSAKDQSYFLYHITQSVLSRILMPVGGMSKADVRSLAREARLSVADRLESQDVCFVPGGDVAAFLEQASPGTLRPGSIEDGSGRVLGEHRGIGLYTVGQRSGLGLTRPRPTYVVALDAARNVVIVGDEEDLFSSELAASDVNWTAGDSPAREFRAEAKVRYAARAGPCAVSVTSEGFRLRFDTPQRAIAPGQSVVLYDGDTVLGGGTIDG
ncbi:MAG: tRNA 2-thiouridine(34) synthase MnmA [Candidatus Eisenbacteria bacterium]|nr:tRNA 2-thiouridine(34) synthase MnmA [Candidatus Eisenbacteria bacterium]